MTNLLLLGAAIALLVVSVCFLISYVRDAKRKKGIMKPRRR
ncbi:MULTISPECIES: small membrane protein [Klebsiella/Raoultella group]|nr:MULTISPECIES: small membrane protein [Klebsiella/Raoultella group]MCF6672336.1 small membrane protein [Raoultella ornithinolytica]WIO41079.1 small membrane protein [Klebsiella electrica]